VAVTPGAATAAGSALPFRHDRLLGGVLASLAHWYLAWRDQDVPGDAGACGLRDEYLRRCATVGRDVIVALPNGRSLVGRADGVNAAGALEVITSGGPVQVSAGDVLHVRPAMPAAR
jgi:BirA family biotin operon repressor/biotin-[acetyl-CoA-carboxylase] ligase